MFFSNFQDGRTPLYFAAAYAKDDIIKLLLNRKADATLSGGVSNENCLERKNSLTITALQ